MWSEITPADLQSRKYPTLALKLKTVLTTISWKLIVVINTVNVCIHVEIFTGSECLLVYARLNNFECNWFFLCQDVLTCMHIAL